VARQRITLDPCNAVCVSMRAAPAGKPRATRQEASIDL
jgi:hypothetical protein